MSDRLTKMRESQAQKGMLVKPRAVEDLPVPPCPVSVVEPPKAAAPEKPPKPAKKEKVVAPPREQVIFSCGHHMPYDTLVSQCCRACQNKHRAEFNARRMKKRQEEMDGHADGFRLPHGSRYSTSYDGEAVQWTVTLAIPLEGTGADRLFDGKGSALFATLAKVDQQYRAWVKEQHAKKEGVPNGG